MKAKTVERRLLLQQRRLRDVIRRVLTQLEEAASQTAVKCVLKEMEAQYAKARSERVVWKKRSTEETKSIPQIYDEEAAAASAEPSTFGQFTFFKELGMQSTANGPNAFPDIQEITKM
ncbi:hypothetical protein T11_13942 [Trichinella zimbabwensis]|uniref:Uncharacterized protein n=1 Tax=Trichinella zimbabwensis TaxID=268475 RepID=A0A0V1HWV0_9BILA|nr:hypothetical protein T11_13942 [Trichinella zimbabwensis]